MQKQQTKKCPFCAEEINVEAIKCKHCGEMISKVITKKNKETVSKKNNKNAIIGFVLSAISIFGVGLAGIVGMIFGIVAITQIKHTHEKGKGWAIAAIVIGLIWGFGIGILRRLVEMGY